MIVARYLLKMPLTNFLDVAPEIRLGIYRELLARSQSHSHTLSSLWTVTILTRSMTILRYFSLAKRRVMKGGLRS